MGGTSAGQRLCEIAWYAVSTTIAMMVETVRAVRVKATPNNMAHSAADMRAQLDEGGGRRTIRLPGRVQDQPDRDRLAQRFEKFMAAR